MSPVWPKHWRAFDELFFSPWIMRAWIVQEAVVHDDTRILYAGGTVPWEGFMQTMNLARTPNVQWALWCLDDSYMMNGHHGSAAKSLLDICTLRDAKAVSQQQTVIELLILTRVQFATNPRDKVYSVLGLAKDSNQYPPPDYTKSVERVFTETAIGVLQT